MSIRTTEWIDSEDEAFLFQVRIFRYIGYGRMMQIISDEYRRLHGDSALMVSETYGSMKAKRVRCQAEGHDFHDGNEFRWCDRCDYSEPQ